MGMKQYSSDSAKNRTATVRDRVDAVVKACRLIEGAQAAPSLEALAEAVGMSRFHFQRVFKKITGVTPKAYETAHRANRMREQLSQSKTVTDAIYAAGFNSNG